VEEGEGPLYCGSTPMPLTVDPVTTGLKSNSGVCTKSDTNNVLIATFSTHDATVVYIILTE